MRERERSEKIIRKNEKERERGEKAEDHINVLIIDPRKYLSQTKYRHIL